jgi:polyphosphate kinase 2
MAITNLPPAGATADRLEGKSHPEARRVRVRHAREKAVARRNGSSRAARDNGADRSRDAKTDAEPGRMKRKAYDKAMKKLHGELVKVQLWAKHTGARIVVIFEGRDAAGKGGVIKTLTERTSPRVFRVVALPSPTEREKSQMYMQRYIENLPAGGEVMLFDRSWYNRAGVEAVMGFCRPKEVERFLRLCPLVERAIIGAGIKVIKFWFEVSQEEQTRRFKDRIADPRKVWKLSPMDLESHRRWYDYSRARDAMFHATDTNESPWYVVDANDKRRARINCITHLLSLIPYEDVPREKIKLPERQKSKGYTEPTYPWRRVPNVC